MRPLKSVNSILRYQRRKAQEAESEIRNLLAEIKRLMLERDQIDLEINRIREKISEYTKIISNYDDGRANELANEITKELDNSEEMRDVNKQGMSINNDELSLQVSNKHGSILEKKCKIESVNHARMSNRRF